MQNRNVTQWQMFLEILVNDRLGGKNRLFSYNSML